MGPVISVKNTFSDNKNVMHLENNICPPAGADPETFSGGGGGAQDFKNSKKEGVQPLKLEICIRNTQISQKGGVPDPRDPSPGSAPAPACDLIHESNNKCYA